MVTYTAAPGEANSVVISSLSGDPTIRISDGGATIVAGARCRSVGEESCQLLAPPAL